MTNEEDLVYEFGDFRLESGPRILSSRVTGEPVTLTPRAFDLLLLFARRPGQLIDKSELMRALWPRTVVEENNLDQAISAVRQALGEHRGQHRYVQTIHRRGYRFAVPVTVAPSTAATLQGEPAVPSSVPGAPGEATRPEQAVLESTSPTRARRTPRRWLVRLAPVAVLIGGIAAVLYVLNSRPGQDDASPTVRSLAILPFKPIAAGDRNEALQFGIAETLIARLDRPGLSVKPLSSVRRYSDLNQDALAAGHALGVQAVLEGHLQRDGDRLRVSVRLLRIQDGRQLWASRYDESFTDVFSVQDSIATKVWTALVPELRGRKAPVLPQYTADPIAYQLYLSGRYYREQRLSGDGIRQALAYFEQAVARDPDFALAWVGLSDAYALLGVFGAVTPNEAFPEARKAVDRALQLAPELGSAHAALGHIKTQYEHDWEGARQQYLRALELDPSYAGAHQFYGQFLAYSGKFDEALAQLRKAQALEPAVPNYAAIMGLLLSFQGHHAEAIAQLQRALAMDERQSLARAFLAMAYLHQGDYQQALEEFDRTNGRAPFCTGCRGQIYARTGRRAEAESEAERLIALARQRYVSAYDIASIYGSLGEADRTFEWLDKAFTERAQHVAWLPWDPAFDAIRKDARYARLAQQLNLR